MTINVRLDAFDADEIPNAMWLHADRVDGGWNGFAVPVVTAGEFRRFIGALAVNDRNGTWNWSSIVEADGALIYEDECGRDVWSVVGREYGVQNGAAVYALDGWQWVEQEWDGVTDLNRADAS